MARLKGVIKIVGHLDDLSCYEMDGLEGEIIVRKGWGPDKTRMRTSKSFESQRLHGKEFGACAKHSSVLRRALRGALCNLPQLRLTGQVNKLMYTLLKLDMESLWGERSTLKGLESTDALQVLQGFNFNTKTALKDVLKKKPLCDLKKGELNIKELLPGRDILFPEGASAVELKTTHALVDLEGGTYEVTESETVVLTSKHAKKNIILQTKGSRKGKGLEVLVLSLSFRGEQNGKQSLLEEKLFNVCSVAGFDYRSI